MYLMWDQSPHAQKPDDDDDDDDNNNNNNIFVGLERHAVGISAVWILLTCCLFSIRAIEFTTFISDVGHLVNVLYAY